MEVLNKLYLMPSKLIKQYSILYSAFRGEVGPCQQKAITQRGKVSGELTKHYCRKGTQGIQHRQHTAVSGLITTALQWRRSPVLSNQKPKLQLPQDPFPRSLLTLPSIFQVLEKKLFSFSIHQGLGEKLPRPWPQAITYSAKRVPGLEKDLHSPQIRASGKALAQYTLNILPDK